MTNEPKEIQVPISAVSTSSHSEQRSQARQSRWYCGKTWESRSVPNLKVSAQMGDRLSSCSNEQGLFAFYMDSFFIVK